jgi:hypothetical protein
VFTAPLCDWYSRVTWAKPLFWYCPSVMMLPPLPAVVADDPVHHASRKIRVQIRRTVVSTPLGTVVTLELHAVFRACGIDGLSAFASVVVFGADNVRRCSFNAT